MTIVAWDIETCPQPLSAFTEAQRARYEQELAYQRERRPELSEDEASRLARSTHPFLGWICCISAVSGTLRDGPNRPVSWTAETPDAEDGLLAAFWEAVARFPRGTLWVTFNGKRFDVPFVEARSAQHGIAPSRADLTNTYPYRHRPHADLARLWPQHYALADLCELLGIASPKARLDGSQVARCVADGRIDEVSAYCERDAVSTFECLRRVPYVLD